MMVRITKCTDEECWYADKIGQDFQVGGVEEEWPYYEVKGTLNVIEYDDCELVKPSKKAS